VNVHCSKRENILKISDNAEEDSQLPQSELKSKIFKQHHLWQGSHLDVMDLSVYWQTMLDAGICNKFSS